MVQEDIKKEKPTTGNKVCDFILFVVLVLSGIGIIAFGVSGIMELLSGNVFKMLPNIIYIMMYVSIIQYTITYFAKGERASIYSMLFNYCMLTLMSNVTLPQSDETKNIFNIILILAVVIIIVTGHGLAIKNVFVYFYLMFFHTIIFLI